MTARRPDPSALPGWPRLLSLDLAAAYCGLSPNAFAADIGTLWPGPIEGTRRKLWDRLALDQAIDSLPGAAVQSGPKSLAQTREARREAWGRH
jgi:hypothetical protein